MYTRQVQGVSGRSRSITAGIRDYSRGMACMFNARKCDLLFIQRVISYACRTFELSPEISSNNRDLISSYRFSAFSMSVCFRKNLRKKSAMS